MKQEDFKTTLDPQYFFISKNTFRENSEAQIVKKNNGLRATPGWMQAIKKIF